MLDMTTVLSAMGGVGTLTVLQQTIGWYREERRKARTEARTEAAAPAAHQSLILGIADQATVLQQRMIKQLEDKQAQMELELGTLRSENQQLQTQMAAKDGQIARLYTRIGQLEVEISQIDDHRPP